MRVTGSLFTFHELSQSIKDGRFVTYSGITPLDTNECVVLAELIDTVKINTITGSLLRYPTYDEVQPSSSSPSNPNVPLYYYMYSYSSSQYAYGVVQKNVTGSVYTIATLYGSSGFQSNSTILSASNQLIVQAIAGADQKIATTTRNNGSLVDSYTTYQYDSVYFSHVTAVGDSWEVIFEAYGFSSGGGGTCLTAGTLITLSDGTYKAVEDIEVGDSVIGSYVEDMPADENLWYKWRDKEMNYKFTENKVTSVQEAQRDSVISFNDGMLITSKDHRHIVKENGLWRIMFAEDLKIGYIFINSYGVEVEIESIEEIKEPHTVYNIVVDGQHTYFANNILTHNKIAPPIE